MKEKKESSFSRLMGFAENYKSFTYIFACSQCRKQRSCASSVLLHMENNKGSA